MIQVKNASSNLVNQWMRSSSTRSRRDAVFGSVSLCWFYLETSWLRFFFTQVWRRHVSSLTLFLFPDFFFFLKFGRQRETVESPLSWVIYHAAQKGQPIKTRVLSFKLYGRAIYGLIKQRQLLCFVFWSVFFRFQIFFWSGPLVSSFLLFPLSGIFRLEQ